MESAFLLNMDKCVGKGNSGAGPSLDLGQMEMVMSSSIFQPIFSSDIHAFLLMTLSTSFHYLCIAIPNFTVYFLSPVCHTCCCASGYYSGQMSCTAVAMGRSSMRRAAVSVLRAGRAVTAPVLPAPATAVVMGDVMVGSVSVMSLTSMRTAAISSALRTAAAMGSATQPKGSASAMRSSLGRTAVRNDVLGTAVAMGSVTQGSATAMTASLALNAPRVSHACQLFLPSLF